MFNGAPFVIGLLFEKHCILMTQAKNDNLLPYTQSQAFFGK
jgi:hypothetical protein